MQRGWALAGAIITVAIVTMLLRSPATVPTLNAARDIWVGAFRATLGR